MATPANLHLIGLASGRPAASASNEGIYYTETDTDGGTTFRSNGASWDQVAAGVSAVGGGGTFVGARVYNSANQLIATNNDTLLGFDTDRRDTDNFHFTSSANLTGTVTKTASSTTLTGSGTSFTTELSVGQMISVPGTAAEKRVVTSIASNTSLTVATAFANSASGQTAARVNTAIVIPSSQAGDYLVGGTVSWASNGTGIREIYIRLNGTTIIAYQWQSASTTFSVLSAITLYDFSAWDYIEVLVAQTSGGNLNATRDADYAPVFWVTKQG